MKSRLLAVGTLALVVLAFGCTKKDEEVAQPSDKPLVIAPPPAGEIPAPADVAAPPANAETTESGLACVVIRKGAGNERPEIYDTVRMHQVVWTTDGKMHMNSGNRGAPVEFDVTQSVLPGLREAIELMVVGEKRRCWIPGRLAFGEAGPNPATDGKPRGTLVYELDLVTLTKSQGLPDAPPDVAAVPAHAEKSKSGLAWKVLKEGSGEERVNASSIVTLLYTGWTPEGEVFMATRGNTPKVAAMTQLIAGWQEALMQMAPGEKRRLWIPAELAYRGQPGRPQGMVVVDLELFGIAK